MLKEIIEFAKNPTYQEHVAIGNTDKIKYILKLVVLAFFLSVVLSIIIASLETIFGFELGKHAMDDFLHNYPVVYLFLFAVIGAPLIEELLFRGPMIWFKESKVFPFVFYMLTGAFGFMHITNYEMNTQTILLSPILVSPQLSAGLLLGFTRIKFGLLYAMALHAMYNLVLTGPIFLFKLLDIPIK